MSNKATISNKDSKRLRGLHLPAFSGKTSQIKILNGESTLYTDKDCIFVDADEIPDKSQLSLKKASSVGMFPFIKKKVSKFLKSYPKYIIYIDSSCHILLKFLAVKDSKILSLSTTLNQ